MAHEVKIYGRPNCTHCTRAVNLMERKGWAYEYHDLTKMETTEAFAVFKESNMKSVPQVKVNGTFIGGADELTEFVRLSEQEAM